MNRVLRIAFLVIFAAAAGHAQAPARPYAEWLIFPGLKNSPSVEIWQLDEAGSQFKWRMVTRSGEVLAEMPQPRLRPGYSYNPGQCKIHGVYRQDLIAMARYKDGVEWSADVAQLWLTDADKKRFLEVPPSDIVCLNQGFGL